jgi:hypothetical protein
LIIKRTAVTLSERAEPTGTIGTPASPPPETDSGTLPEPSDGQTKRRTTMANFRSYCTSTWRWVVWKGDELVADFATKWEADKYAVEHGGTVKKIRW